MEYKKKYIKPNTQVIVTTPYSILASSDITTCKCDSYCKIWHICRDRESGKICKDYQSKF